jgi:large conductance mechanosensitive channel
MVGHWLDLQAGQPEKYPQPELDVRLARNEMGTYSLRQRTRKLEGCTSPTLCQCDFSVRALVFLYRGAKSGEKSMFKGFRDFVLRGNVVDLAVGVVIGAAFGTVVAALVKDLITPIIAALVKKPDFSGFFFEINGAKFLYGDFANAVISFLLIAGAVYYFVVLPVNSLMKRFQAPVTADKRKCPECRSDIALDARRCAFCTSSVA